MRRCLRIQTVMCQRVSGVSRPSADRTARVATRVPRSGHVTRVALWTLSRVCVSEIQYTRRRITVTRRPSHRLRLYHVRHYVGGVRTVECGEGPRPVAPRSRLRALCLCTVASLCGDLARRRGGGATASSHCPHAARANLCVRFVYMLMRTRSLLSGAQRSARSQIRGI